MRKFWLILYFSMAFITFIGSNYVFLAKENIKHNSQEILIPEIVNSENMRVINFGRNFHRIYKIGPMSDFNKLKPNGSLSFTTKTTSIFNLKAAKISKSNFLRLVHNVRFKMIASLYLGFNKKEFLRNNFFEIKTEQVTEKPQKFVYNWLGDPSDLRRLSIESSVMLHWDGDDLMTSLLVNMESKDGLDLNSLNRVILEMHSVELKLFQTVSEIKKLLHNAIENRHLNIKLGNNRNISIKERHELTKIQVHQYLEKELKEKYQFYQPYFKELIIDDDNKKIEINFELYNPFTKIAVRFKNFLQIETNMSKEYLVESFKKRLTITYQKCLDRQGKLWGEPIENQGRTWYATDLLISFQAIDKYEKMYINGRELFSDERGVSKYLLKNLHYPSITNTVAIKKVVGREIIGEYIMVYNFLHSFQLFTFKSEGKIVRETVFQRDDDGEEHPIEIVHSQDIVMVGIQSYNIASSFYQHMTLDWKPLGDWKEARHQTKLVTEGIYHYRIKDFFGDTLERYVVVDPKGKINLITIKATLKVKKEFWKTLIGEHLKIYLQKKVRFNDEKIRNLSFEEIYSYWKRKQFLFMNKTNDKGVIDIKEYFKDSTTILIQAKDRDSAKIAIYSVISKILNHDEIAYQKDYNFYLAGRSFQFIDKEIQNLVSFNSEGVAKQKIQIQTIKTSDKLMGEIEITVINQLWTNKIDLKQHEIKLYIDPKNTDLSDIKIELRQQISKYFLENKINVEEDLDYNLTLTRKDEGWLVKMEAKPTSKVLQGEYTFLIVDSTIVNKVTNSSDNNNNAWLIPIVVAGSILVGGAICYQGYRMWKKGQLRK